MNKHIKKLKELILIFVGLFLWIYIFSFLLVNNWNSVIPELFGLPQITIGQAIDLHWLLLFLLLFVWLPVQITKEKISDAVQREINTHNVIFCCGYDRKNTDTDKKAPQ
ncbi:MAG: hypothetical protein KAI72_09160 [Candidatus Pacebacteria bacterium]|nr:hypothetical protein [Candidatus Paceibacterota bacterium]